MHLPDMLAVERCACGCDACGAAIPAGLDHALARETELGLYHVALTDVPASANDPGTLTVFVTRGPHPAPQDAEIAIAGGRPRCSCAAPDLAITRRGAGHYETAPFAFPSRGWWILRVTVAGEGGRDAVTFNLAIE